MEIHLNVRKRKETETAKVNEINLTVTAIQEIYFVVTEEDKKIKTIKRVSTVKLKGIQDKYTKFIDQSIQVKRSR
jgi:hypothetical protein